MHDGLDPADKDGVGRRIILAFQPAIEGRECIVQHRSSSCQCSPGAQLETLWTVDFGHSGEPFCKCRLGFGQKICREAAICTNIR